MARHDDDPGELLTKAKVVAALDISTDVLDEMIAHGLFPDGGYVGRTKRWASSVVLDFKRWLRHGAVPRIPGPAPKKTPKRGRQPPHEAGGKGRESG